MFGIVHLFVDIACVSYLILTLTEMTILKVIYIYKFSRIAAVNEYFINRMLIFLNFAVIMIFTSIRIILKEYETNPGFIHYKDQIPLYQLKVRTDEHENIIK